MGVVYKIEAENKISADIWKTITDSFNCVVTKMQHSTDGETLYVYIKATDKKHTTNR